MKAWQINRFGPPDVLELREMPDPVAAEGEVVVRIRAASLNGADLKVRRGHSQTVPGLTFPHVSGRDFSGEIEQVGPGVTDLKPGDAVFGVVARGKEGAYAERLAIPAALVGPKPEGVSHVEAAALALTGLTTLVALEDDAKLARGQRILIQGAAGGVGSFAVQYARHVGAEVHATARLAHHDYVRSLGADVVLDYRGRPFEEVVADCDVVLDTVGGEVHRRSLSVLKPGGVLVHIVAAPKGVEPPAGIRLVRPQVWRDRAHLRRIAEMVGQGAVRPPALHVFPFTDAPGAHALLEAGGVPGKVVLDLGA